MPELTEGVYDVNGDGTKDSAYEISNAGNLYWFAKRVNGGKNNINGVLTCDITVNPGIFDKSGNYTPVSGESVRQWTPIGSSGAMSFNGSFDGRGFAVSGLNFNDDTVTFAGFFGFAAPQAVISNVTVKNSYFSAQKQVGGIAGRSQGLIKNCRNEAYISGETEVGGICGINDGNITDSHNSGFIKGKSTVSSPTYFGGICASNNPNGSANVSIARCSNSSNISVLESNSNIGGIASDNKAPIYDCLNTGSLSGKNNVGGICAENSGYSSIKNCYNAGAVSSQSSDSLGAICAYNGTYATIAGCYYDSTQISVKGCPYNINNTANSVMILPKTTDKFKSGEVAYLLQAAQTAGTDGVIPLVWGQTIGTDDYPVLYGKEVSFEIGGTYYNPHKHPICGENCTHTGESTHTDELWTGITALTDIKADGCYYLENDIALTRERFQVNYNITLCLNGHKITKSDIGSQVFLITQKKKLTVTDCSEKKSYGKWNSTKTEYSVTEEKPESGDFDTLTGGMISGGSYPVHIANTDGVFAMFDGNIVGNPNSGAGITALLGNFTMTGGGIYGCNDSTVQVQSGGSFTMAGGTVCSNKGTSGAGVKVASGGSFTMTGGSIVNNAASVRGGGVYIERGTLTISGDPKITGNTTGGASGTASNLFLHTTVFTVGTSGVKAGASIGISTYNKPMEGTPVKISGSNNADYSLYFTSDNADYIVENTSENVLQLADREYPINISSTENGTVTAKVNETEVTSAAKGKQIVLTATPNVGYELESLTVKDTNGNSISLDSDNAFTMPDSSVTVTATFKLHQHTWSYTLNAANDTITATCKNTSGSCPNTAGGSVKISAPTNTLYTGSAIAATVSENPFGLTADDIKYYKVGTEGDTQLNYVPTEVGTYKATLTYENQTAFVEYEIYISININISWGEMSFTYTDKKWNPDTHTYIPAEWKDGGSGWISVENAGESDVTVDCKYNTDRTDITGKFADDGGSVYADPFPLNTQKSKKLWLKLSGEPSEALSEATLGTVSVSIGNYVEVIDTYEELQAALNNGGEIRLGDNITVTQNLNVNGKTVTLDLRGKTLTMKDSNASDNLGTYFTIDNAASNVIIKDSVGGGRIFNETSNTGFYIRDGALTLEDVCIDATGAMVLNVTNSGKLTVNNGTVLMGSDYIITTSGAGKTEINGGTISGYNNFAINGSGNFKITGSPLFKPNPSSTSAFVFKYWGGEFDISQLNADYAADITIKSYADTVGEVGTNILMPTGWSLYDENGTAVTDLIKGKTYTAKATAE